MIRLGSYDVEALVLRPSLQFPLNETYLPLEPGLTVLYGLNGAGKSLVLEALHNSATGSPTDRTTDCHAGLVMSATGRVDLYYGLVHDGDQSLADPTERIGDRVSELFRSQFPQHVAEDLFQQFWPDQHVLISPGSAPALIAAIYDTGPAADRLWTVNALVRIARDLPVVQRILDHDASLLQPLPYPPPPVDAAQGTSRQIEPGAWTTSYEGVLDNVSWTTRIGRLPIWFPETADPDEITLAALRDLVGPDLRDVASGGAGAFGLAAKHLGDNEDDPVRWAVEWFADELSTGLRGLLGPTYDSRLDEQTRQSWTATDEFGELRADAGIAILAETIAGRVNHLYRRLLLDCPDLWLDLGTPISWAGGSPPQWRARRHEQSPWIPLSALSAAERKWATIAIFVALKFPSDAAEGATSGLLLIDEPEASLHRSAEAYMARGLAELATIGLSVMVASHSPEVLNADGAHVWHVTRKDKHIGPLSQVQPLGRVEVDTLIDLGLRPADLIGMQRGFLVVEGEHDVAVLDVLLGDELRKRRIRILPAFGTKKMQEAIQARVLYDFSDAHVFALVDAVELSTVREAWERAKSLATGPDGLRAADIEISRTLGRETRNEDRFLKEFMRLALRSGVYNRQTPLALPKADVLEYLDVAYFLPGAESWGELRRRADAEVRQRKDRRRSGPVTGAEFKDWLRNAGAGNRLTTAGIRAAAGTLKQVPPDLLEILDAIDSVLERQRFQEEGL